MLLVANCVCWLFSWHVTSQCFMHNAAQRGTHIAETYLLSYVAAETGPEDLRMLKREKKRIHCLISFMILLMS